MLSVVEKFVSINGEGKRAGELAAFIRFKGCNLNCSYCDTRWANQPDAASNACTVAELADWVKSSGVKNVTLTGGEPLLQAEIAELTEALLACRAKKSPCFYNGLQASVKRNGRLYADRKF